jgi:hypothetical protein
VLSTFGVVKDVSGCMIPSYALAKSLFIFQQKYMTADEINVGISALLQTFEMVYVKFNSSFTKRVNN